MVGKRYLVIRKNGGGGGSRSASTSWSATGQTRTTPVKTGHIPATDKVLRKGRCANSGQSRTDPGQPRTLQHPNIVPTELSLRMGTIALTIRPIIFLHLRFRLLYCWVHQESRGESCCSVALVTRNSNDAYHPSSARPRTATSERWAFIVETAKRGKVHENVR